MDEKYSLKITCVALLYKKTVLSLETSSEINFEFIKFVKKYGKCLPLTKTNREYYINITFPDWVMVENIIPRNVIINLSCASVDNPISRDDIFDYHPNRECNIYFIIPNMRSFIFYRLRPTMMSLLSICMNENNIFLKMVVSSSLNARTDRDVRSYKLRHKKSKTPNLIPSSVI